MLLSESLFENFPPPTQKVFSNNLVFVLLHSLITHSVLFEIQRCSPGVREDIEKLDACRQNTLGKRKNAVCIKLDGFRLFVENWGLS